METISNNFFIPDNTFVDITPQYTKESYPKFVSNYTDLSTLFIEQLDFPLLFSHSDFNKIKSVYKCDAIDFIKIKNFLYFNNKSTDLLLKAPGQIENYFGKVRLSLELDNDSDNSKDQLFINIYSSLPVEEYIQKEEKFKKEWFLNERRNSNFSVNISYGI